MATKMICNIWYYAILPPSHCNKKRHNQCADIQPALTYKNQ